MLAVERSEENEATRPMFKKMSSRVKSWLFDVQNEHQGVRPDGMATVWVVVAL